MVKLSMIKNLILLLSVFILWPTVGATQQPNVFTWDAKALMKNKAKIRTGDAAIAPAWEQLVKDAEKALQFGPVSVMEKKNLPPSGDKHDYMSLAPYFWPDPSKPNGLPYMRKDGETNPEVKNYKDKEYMPKLCEEVSTLALAYYFSEEKKYAEHAAKLIRVWFLDTATRMNPNLNFGQAIKGVTNGRGAGMIDTRHFVKLIDAAQLLQHSKAFTAEDYIGLQQWFSNFLNWMQASKIGLDEMDAKNNHGIWYDVQRLSMALFLDSAELAKKIVLNAQERLDKQMDASGSFPLEMERTTSLHYTTFAMQAFFHVAKMAEKTGINFWTYKSPSGKSLQKGLDVLQPYLAGQKKWAGPQIKDFEFEEGLPLLMTGALKFGCKTCRQSIQNIAADKAGRLRLNLLNP
ncbi:MAG: alginate lyase family protein [Bacteroidota bacterium]